MLEEHEAELRIALSEGLISREEAEGLREEARHRRLSPLAVLRERGVLSEKSLASLRGLEEEPTVTRARPGGADTLGPALTLQDRHKVDPRFPVPNWERYQGVRFLGQGGMGQVFLAYDPRLRRNVALKFVRGDDTELVQRLLSEARAQARVDHERVCQVFEVGEVEGRPFIAMQYVNGQPLSQLTHELTVEQKAMVLRDAAEGVHAAHRAGLIHRDLKPSNILVERTEDGRLKPFVMDFGLAREWSESGNTATGAVLGTPHFMSPEQARGEVARLDRRADVYSLGATLYHLITGRHAIPGTNGLEVLTNIPTVEPSSPRKLDPDVPRDLEAIVLKCLEKDRSARYDSARALAEDLDRFLAGEPVLARPMGLGYRLRKKALKHRVAVSVSAVALLAVALALGWAFYTQRQASRREYLARRFTEQVEHIEALARYSGLSPLHDTRADLQELRQHIATLESEVARAGGLAAAPGRYALGRGALALGDEVSARQHLEAAWRSGYREPRVAYALALVMGHLYQDGLLEAERLRDASVREARRQEVERQYRDPALAYLRQSEGADVPSTEYVAALLSFYEGRFDDALARLDAMGNRLPWFYEAPLLRGDILQARAARHWNQGEGEEAKKDLEEGRRAYAAAADIGRSVPSVHQAVAKLEYTAMLMALYGQGDVHAPFTRGMEGITRALQALPKAPASLLQEARLYRRFAEAQIIRGEGSREPLDRALAAAREVIQQQPSTWDAHQEEGLLLYFSARILKDRGMDPREQLRAAQQALEKIPQEKRDVEFYNALGLIFFAWAGHDDDTGANSQEHWQNAIDSFQSATRLSPGYLGAWINLGMACYRHADGPMVGPTAQALREQRLQQAWEALQRAMELNPQHWVAYFYGGNIHNLWGAMHRCDAGGSRYLESARELFRKGLAINSQAPNLHNGLGFTLFNLAQLNWEQGGNAYSLLDEAQASYDEAIQLAPRQVYGYLNRGSAFLLRATFQRDQGQDSSASLQAALRSFEQAIHLSQDDPDAQAGLGESLVWLADAELKRGRAPTPLLHRAEKALREALKINPQHPRAWLYLGQSHSIQARWQSQGAPVTQASFDEATRSFEKALALAKDSSDVHLAFGALMHDWATFETRAGRTPTVPLERGLTLVEEALSTCSEWPRALLLRAQLRRMRAVTETANAAEQQAWMAQSRNDLSLALKKNPNLAPGWKD
ncbi:serine/threonine-protein kinase [Stigmatella aurantiaca]|uniref:Serine/threonine kinase family protein n=1 Tax=Stigmatella aurantiaca (strain DW4/3-1) TaxID=378806 RepID=Q098I7_STIAD|nr:serine/threonine-protein kinase [Stigmatella aurantiaca]ADO68113.1 Serine/threonine kinase family protein [Stigmatella aurantiaca DW4/3-1]EAU68152.1 serine/threonine protein kinase [Stigmatella aurantiaca DW4/3-1]